MTIPGGRSKGQPLDQASDEDLLYWANRIRRELPDAKPHFRARDTELLHGIEDEQRRRYHAGVDCTELSQ
jgi:hypothetical protein